MEARLWAVLALVLWAASVPVFIYANAVNGFRPTFALLSAIYAALFILNIALKPDIFSGLSNWGVFAAILSGLLVSSGVIAFSKCISLDPANGAVNNALAATYPAIGVILTAVAGYFIPTLKQHVRWQNIIFMILAYGCMYFALKKWR